MIPQSQAVTGHALLATKLHLPRARPDAVRRQRLTGRLDARRDAPVTLISAPAGFGKTSLLAEWLGSAGDRARPVGWVALDDSDNDPALFWSYVLAAIQGAVPHVGGGAIVALGESQPVKSVVAALLNDLHDSVDQVLLVLDDYHVIQSTEVHDSVTYLIDHIPPTLHLVIASRSDPPIPLARLRARGQLIEIRAVDLRFTHDESSAYLNDTMGLRLADRDVDSLGARTEGWIAALQLAALSLQGRDDVERFIAGFAGDDRFVVDYLAEEVLDRQPDAIRSFLLQTSILDRLTGSLCEAVTATAGGKATLEQLERSNLFVVALDDRREWYRYHHLFADVLRSRLVEQEPAIVNALHRRASRWYADHDEPAAAVEHALAGQHVEEAARLVEMTAPVLRRTRQEATLRRWLEALPTDIFDDRPVLAIGLVGARMATGDATDVESLLQRVESALARPAGSSTVFDLEMFAGLPAQVAVQRAGLALLNGDVEGTVAHATAALGLIEESDHLRRAAATALMALAHWTAGELDAAAVAYAKAVSGLEAAGHLADMLGCLLALADIQIAHGKLSDAVRTFESGLRTTREHRGLRGAPDMHVGLSEVLIERNELDAATQHLANSAELGEPAGLPQHAYRWRVAMARLSLAKGDLVGALELIDEAAPRYNTDFSPPVRPVAAIRARVELARGNVEEALAWVHASGLSADDELSYVREYEHITLAHVLIAADAVEHGTSIVGALALLERLKSPAVAGGRTGSTIEILILQATAHHARGDLAAATAHLEDAFERAEPEGYVRVFPEAGAAVTVLMRSLASRRASVHARRVLAAIDGTQLELPTKPTVRSALVDPLSPRELDVLRLLRSELSGPEIARELHVSLNTLRTHTKNIFTKLDATNRREALRRASELGL